MNHNLKCHPKPFLDLWSGDKKAEVRKDDRGFSVGDELTIKEWVPCSRPEELGYIGEYTGREIRAQVTHIQRDYGLPDGLVVLSLAVLIKFNYSIGARVLAPMRGEQQ